MKTFLSIIALGAIGYGGYLLMQNNNATNQTSNNYSAENENQSTQTPSESKDLKPMNTKPIATIETSMGTFKVTLDGESAPKTVENFVKLAKDNFYNGLKFHRVIPNFVIQGGDPSGDGTGGPGYTIPAEIKLKHTKGAIATARTGDQVNPTRASSGSQFYVALQDLPTLDGQYTVFGYVTEGMDVVSKIGLVPTDPENDMPLKEVTIIKVTIQE
jgi:peptidyl-prolyl cis-trans isomerase B (cyclophilin B)